MLCLFVWVCPVYMFLECCHENDFGSTNLFVKKKLELKNLWGLTKGPRAFLVLDTNCPVEKYFLD